MKLKIGITGCSGSLGKFILKKKGFKFICFKGDIRKKKDIRNWLSKNDLNALIILQQLSQLKL